eukprot:GHVU01026516.1.p2 GENE.GHVU01026516.1~~GHVU01026516.1.p2  ORF type:complete len:125 (+),score=1.81 GHVU01026516.1:1394-1768(+)
MVGWTMEMSIDGSMDAGETGERRTVSRGRSHTHSNTHSDDGTSLRTAYTRTYVGRAPRLDDPWQPSPSFPLLVTSPTVTYPLRIHVHIFIQAYHLYVHVCSFEALSNNEFLAVNSSIRRIEIVI